MPQEQIPISFRILFFSCFLYLSLFGCSASLKEAKPIKEDIPYAISEEPSIKHEKSLWQDNGSLSELFIDPTAIRIGDIVTIQIVESSKATNKATTNTGRNSSISAGIDSFFGLEQNFPSSGRFYSSP
jgi:flagellar L-ring protein precursor FlgH